MFTGAMTSAPGTVNSTWYATARVVQSVHDARAQASLCCSTRAAVTMAQETARSAITASSTVLTAMTRLSPSSASGGSGHGNGHASRMIPGSGSGPGAGVSGAVVVGPWGAASTGPKDKGFGQGA